MLSLSLTLKQLKEKINNLELGGTSTLTLDTSKIQVGSVTYHDGNPVVTPRYENGNVYLDFILTNPITDAKRFGAVVANSVIHHVIDRIALPSVAKSTFTLTEKPNSCPVVVTVKGFTYLEAGSGDDVFVVDRDNKKLTWYPGRAGFELSDAIAPVIYIGYEVSETVTKIRENVNIESIVNNGFNLTNKPNNTPVVIYINGVSYFEEGNDFTVNRAVDPVSVVWSTAVTGFSLDSSLTGYIAVLYEVDV